MSEINDQGLPTLQTGKEMEASRLNPYWLDPTLEYPEPHYLLEYKGVGFSPLGGIQAISGQKKNGKTFVLAQLMAAILNSDSERVKAKLPGLCVRRSTVEYLGHEPSVLYVDTEMEQLNSAKVLRRVHWLCGWAENKPNPRFRVLWLREVSDDDGADEKNGKRAYQKRLELILDAIEVMNPDAVFIDGIRDIIGDFNDNKESSSLVSKLMALASKRSICVWSVLHMNPRPGNDDESKMRGHLGTELGNKVSDTFQSIKKKTPTNVTFTVRQNDARGKDVEDWTFEVTDDAGGLGIPRIIDNASVITNGVTTEQWKLVAPIFRNIIKASVSASHTKLREGLKKKLSIGSERAAQWVTAAEARKLIQKINDKYILDDNVYDELVNPDPFA